MNLLDILKRALPPEPWSEGENIPWDDPDFSRRMLAEHLSQEHNQASRRFEIIDRQVQWVHKRVLGGKPTRILDVTCGPGFYTSRLSRLGHTCVGIDFAPAAIYYAREAAARGGLACTYRLEDVRQADWGAGHGLVMMLFGQFNVFRPDDARLILERAFAALAPGGRLLLEPQRFAAVEHDGRAGRSWYACGEAGGLFADRPHLCLVENFWDSQRQAATQRFFIQDAHTGTLTRHALTTAAYADHDYRELLAQAGFAAIRFFPSLTGVAVQEPSQAANLAVVGRKPLDSDWSRTAKVPGTKRR
jgi:SAM-dependent methyltransferase